VRVSTQNTQNLMDVCVWCRYACLVVLVRAIPEYSVSLFLEIESRSWIMRKQARTHAQLGSVETKNAPEPASRRSADLIILGVGLRLSATGRRHILMYTTAYKIHVGQCASEPSRAMHNGYYSERTELLIDRSGVEYQSVKQESSPTNCSR
jgi:hypothetical protein